MPKKSTPRPSARHASGRRRTGSIKPSPSARTSVAKARKRWVDYVLSIGLMIIGLFGIATVSSNPLPAASLDTPTSRQVAAQTSQPHTLPRSLPTRLEIPDIGVSTDLIQLGKNEDGSLETPSDYERAGWYKYSPTPGEIGPAIITGHVDNYLGPAVFFNLQYLKPEQRISVHREDGSTAVFAVDEVKAFSQDAFPTDEVYGNIDHAGLRLITCGGTYNPLTGHYSHNVVVYASLIKDP